MAVNPGSVGLPGYDGQKPVYHVVQTGTPDACYAILEKGGLEKGGLEKAGRAWSVTFRHVPYDPQPMAALAARAGLPLWANAINTGWFR